MKTLCKIMASFVVMIAFIFSAKAQVPKLPMDETTKLITYTGVVTTQGSKDSLYLRGLEWINSYFKNPAGVTEKRDKENGEFVCKHNFEVFNYDEKGNKIVPAHAMIKYTLTIVFKDGRYKYTITNLNVKGTSYLALEKWQSESPKHDIHLKQVDDYMKELIKSLKQGMTFKAAAKKEEW